MIAHRLAILIFILGLVFTSTACVNEPFADFPVIDQDVRRAVVLTLRQAVNRHLSSEKINDIFKSEIIAIMQVKGVPDRFQVNTFVSKFPNDRFVFEYAIETRGNATGSMLVVDSEGNDAELMSGEKPKSKLFDR